jgi:endogenous inhibitor of DNA gyrase (YacG/DUF329 family)
MELSFHQGKSDLAPKCVASFRRAVWKSDVQHYPFVATSCAITLGDWLSGRTKPYHLAAFPERRSGQSSRSEAPEAETGRRTSR